MEVFLFISLPLIALMLLSYIGGRLRPVDAKPRRLSTWEDAGLVLAFLGAQILLNDRAIYDNKFGDVIVIYGLVFVPLLATAVSRSTRPFIIAMIASAIYFLSLVKLVFTTMTAFSLDTFLILALVSGVASLFTMLFVIPMNALHSKYPQTP